MSQSRFSIVLVGVSALLRRPLVSRLRPAVFSARGDLPFRRFPLGGLTFGLTASAFRHAPLRGCRSVGWPSGSRLPLFGTHRFGVALGGLAFGFTASAFRHAPLRSCHSAGWPSGSRLPLFGMRRFGIALGGLVLLPPASEIAARRVGASAFRFGDCPRQVGASAFRFGDCRSAGWPSGSRFRFSARTASGLPLGGLVLLPSASELPSAGWCFRLPLRRLPLGRLVLPPSVSEIAARRVGLRAPVSAFRHAPLRSCHSASWRFRLPFRRLPLGGLVLLPSASAFRHAPLRDCRSVGWFCRLPLRGCRSAGWPSGSRLPLFGMRRSAPPHRRREGRRSTPTRHLFHFKTLIPTC